MLERVASIVAEAGRIAASRCGTGYRSWEKQPGQPVCDVDLEVDSFLREQLTAIDPEAGWLSEETLDDSDRIERRRLWVVDPIDGTRDYLRNRPGWCVSVAIRAVGPRVLEVELARPFDALLALTSSVPLFPLSRREIESARDELRPDRAPVTNGPYRLVERIV